MIEIEAEEQAERGWSCNDVHPIKLDKAILWGAPAPDNVPWMQTFCASKKTKSARAGTQRLVNSTTSASCEYK